MSEKPDVLGRRMVRWTGGGVCLNYHTISGFRTDYEEELNELMTQVVKQLDAAGLVEVNT